MQHCVIIHVIKTHFIVSLWCLCVCLGGLDWQQDRWELPLSFSLFLWVHFGQFNNNLGEISKKKNKTLWLSLHEVFPLHLYSYTNTHAETETDVHWNLKAGTHNRLSITPGQSFPLKVPFLLNLLVKKPASTILTHSQILIHVQIHRLLDLGVLPFFTLEPFGK